MRPLSKALQWQGSLYYFAYLLGIGTEAIRLSSPVSCHSREWAATSSVTAVDESNTTLQGNSNQYAFRSNTTGYRTRWWSRYMLGSPPPVMTSELQVNYRVTILRPTQRLAAQNAYNEGCTEEATLSLNVACLLYLKRKSLVKGSKVKCEIY